MFGTWAGVPGGALMGVAAGTVAAVTVVTGANVVAGAGTVVSGGVVAVTVLAVAGTVFAGAAVVAGTAVAGTVVELAGALLPWWVMPSTTARMTRPVVRTKATLTKPLKKLLNG